MDEAERCHRLAYISYGTLLASGTPEEVLHLFALDTWAVSGPRAALAALASRLHRRPGVSHVTAFGNTLHVTGEDPAALEDSIREFLDDAALQWRRAEPSLEDVFIHLMNAQPQEPR
jgi:ABC-2 type transport system ATP-binding protein